LDKQAYIDLILDHYENPRHKGAVEHASVVQHGGNPGCGDVITLYVTVDEETETIVDIHFEGDGCTISQAGASLLTERMVGKSLQDIEDMGYDSVIDMMGHDIVATRLRCATLALSTLKAAVKKHRGLEIRVMQE